MSAFWWERVEDVRLGVTCRSIEDVQVYSHMTEFDVLEIKISSLIKKGFELYRTDGLNYFLNPEPVSSFKKLVENHELQVHMPFEGDKLIPNERALLHSKVGDHEALINRQLVVAELFDSLEKKGICVWHPPVTKLKAKEVSSNEDAFKNASTLYEELDKRVYWRSLPIQITFENQTSPKLKDNTLGYDVEHFWRLLGNTRRIGITVDTGHGNLAPEDWHFRMFMGSGFPICSVHFHGNKGEFDPKSYHDDEHHFATQENVRGYRRWIAMFKRLGLPIILELNKDYSYKEVQEYAQGLRNELGI